MADRKGLNAVCIAIVVAAVVVGAGVAVADDRRLACNLEIGATKCIVQDRAWTGTNWTDRVTMEPSPSPGVAPEMVYRCPANRRVWLRICQEGTSGFVGRKCQKAYGHWCTTKPEDLK